MKGREEKKEIGIVVMHRVCLTDVRSHFIWVKILFYAKRGIFEKIVPYHY